MGTPTPRTSARVVPAAENALNIVASADVSAQHPGPTNATAASSQFQFASLAATTLIGTARVVPVSRKMAEALRTNDNGRADIGPVPQELTGAHIQTQAAVRA